MAGYKASLFKIKGGIKMELTKAVKMELQNQIINDLLLKAVRTEGIEDISVISFLLNEKIILDNEFSEMLEQTEIPEKLEEALR